MDLLVEKATELGVTAIAPLHLRRWVATGSGRLTRWRAIVREAAEQSGRTRLPAVEAPVPLATFLAALPAEAIRLAEAGFTLLTRGPRILRAETAPLAALALLQFLAGNLG